MPKMASRLVLGEIARSVTNSYGGLWWKCVSQLWGVTVASPVTEEECQVWFLSMSSCAPRVCGDDPSVSPWGRVRVQWFPRMRG